MFRCLKEPPHFFQHVSLEGPLVRIGLIPPTHVLHHDVLVVEHQAVVEIRICLKEVWSLLNFLSLLLIVKYILNLLA